MARIIDYRKCVACGSCIGECPVEAINEGDVYTIDADACIDCGACEAACPNEAIYESYSNYYDSSFSNNDDATDLIEQKVKEIIVEKLGVEESEVTLDASFENDLGADSLDAVELIMEFEKEFGITIPDDQVYYITTVGDAVSYIKGHVLVYSPSNNDDANTSASKNNNEEEYLNQLKELMIEGGEELSPRERKMLDRVRESLGISVERAKELEASLLNPHLTEEEQQYLDTVKEFLSDESELTPRERKMLDRIRESLGINEERGREIESMVSKPQLTEEEQQYISGLKDLISDETAVTPRERKLLDKMRQSLGIGEERANELEAFVLKQGSSQDDVNDTSSSVQTNDADSLIRIKKNDPRIKDLLKKRKTNRFGLGN